jgi:hypothetical protein
VLGFDIDAEDSMFNRNALSGVSKEEKQLKHEIKANRTPYGDPASGTFSGPWGGYDSEKFSNLDLTEEQKEHLS